MTNKAIILSAFTLLLTHFCNAQVALPGHRLPNLSNPGIYPHQEAVPSEAFDLGHGTRHLQRVMYSSNPPDPATQYMILDEEWGTPGLETYFQWDTLNAAWNALAQYAHAYSPDGKRVETIKWVYELGVYRLVDRFSYTYDIAGRMSKAVSSSWDGNAWLLSLRVDLRYDAVGNRTMRSRSTWNGAGWDVTMQDSTRYTYTLGALADTVQWAQWTSWTNNWENGMLYTYHYNNDSLQDMYQYFFWNGNGWNNGRRYEYAYNANHELATTTEFIGLGTIWDLSSLTQWTSWHDYSKSLPAFYIVETYNDTNPSTFQRYSNFYSLYDSRIEHAESQNWQGGWDSLYSLHVDYDVNAHFTALEFYINSAGWWKAAGFDRNFVYDIDNNIIEYWEAHYSYTTELYSKTERLLFDNYFVVANAENDGPLLPKVTAYPNPCTDQLRFVLDLAQDEPVGIALYDLEGRLRMQTLAVVSGGEVCLPLSDVLESGAYVYRVQTNAGYRSGKVMVQR